jgi:hypothetical protein
LASHLEGGCTEQARKPLAQQRAERRLRARDLRLDAGATACGAPDPQAPAQPLHPIGQAAQTRAATPVGSADAVVNDLDHEPPVRVSDLDGRHDAQAYLATLVRLSETT